MLDDEEKPLVIGFGMDSTNFQQTQRVIEIQRFPGNDGTDENRGRDLLLLGVENPFSIDGRTDGYYRPVWHQSAVWYLLTPLHCVGWDLRVSDTSSTSNLREEILNPYTIDTQVTNGTVPAGNRMWWLNTSPDPDQGVLPMDADVGTACFFRWLDVVALATVQSATPAKRRDGIRDNVGREAYSVVLGESVVTAWMRTVMFESNDLDLVAGAGDATVDVVGSVGGCAKGRDRMEIFGVLEDGRMGWWTWDGAWTAREPLDAPTGTNLSPYLPGAYCKQAGGIELFATGTDGLIWQQSMTPDEQWRSEWQRVWDATTPVDSGIAVTGVLDDHFYLFASGSALELRSAEFDGEWTGDWIDHTGPLNGTPAAHSPHEGRINVFIRDAFDDVWQRWMVDGTWQAWASIVPAVSAAPAVVSWGYQHVDVLSRSQSGNLSHTVYQGHWAERVETGVEMPPGTPFAIARKPGTTDLFVTRNDGSVWHGHWPRKPR